MSSLTTKISQGRKKVRLGLHRLLGVIIFYFRSLAKSFHTQCSHILGMIMHPLSLISPIYLDLSCLSSQDVGNVGW